MRGSDLTQVRNDDNQNEKMVHHAVSDTRKLAQQAV